MTAKLKAWTASQCSHLQSINNTFDAKTTIINTGYININIGRREAKVMSWHIESPTHSKIWNSK